MTTFLAMFCIQIVTTLLGAHYARPAERLTVIGMVSIWSAGTWLALVLCSAYYYTEHNLQGYAPITAFAFSLISLAAFWAAYRLEELKSQYGTTPASK